LQSKFDEELCTTGASFATDTFSVGISITETCLPLHNTHLRTALNLLSRYPGFRHAKQHPLLTAKFLFSTKLKLCALGQDSLVCVTPHKRHSWFTHIDNILPKLSSACYAMRPVKSCLSQQMLKVIIILISTL
jgi:hypothetical protein